jgi:hypothetical protein
VVVASPDDFFASLRGDPRLEWLGPELEALRDIRAALATEAPRYVRPEQTRGSISDWAELHLEIPHDNDQSVQISLGFGDGYLVLSWPDASETGGWEWRPELATVVAALLSGRNRQTIHRRAGAIVAVETEIWDEAGNRTRLRSRRWRGLATVVLPFGLRTERRSVSFDRATPLEPQP